MYYDLGGATGASKNADTRNLVTSSWCRSAGGRGVGGGAVRARVPGGVGEAVRRRRRRPEEEALGQDLREPQQDARANRAAETAIMSE